MKSAEQPRTPINWEIRKTDKEGVPEWMIAAQGFSHAAHLKTAFDDDDSDENALTDGLYFQNIHTDTSRRLDKNDLWNLVRKIIACMDDAGVDKLYAHPLNFAANALFERMHAQTVPGHTLSGINEKFGVEVDVELSFVTKKDLRALIGDAD